MRKGIGILAAAVVTITLAGTVIASQSASASKGAKASLTASAVGKITKYDNASRTLTLSTTKGDQTFVLAANATIHHGSKTMPASDISSQHGQRAKVRYSEANGQKVADAVMILSTTLTASAQKPASKPPSK